PPHPTPPTPFPYTTLFRSHCRDPAHLRGRREGERRQKTERARNHRTKSPEDVPARPLLAGARCRRGLQRGDPWYGGREKPFRAEDRKSTRLNSSHQIISYA